MKTKEMSFTGAMFLFTILVIAVIGWVLNVVELFNMPWVSDVAGEVIVRCIGVIIPFIGAVVGYI
jgi:hypothetical protein